MNRVRVINTSRYPAAVVRKLVAFARGEKRCGDVAVNVKNSRYAFAGRCYARVPALSRRKGDRLAVVRLGAPDRFPCSARYAKFATAPEYEFRDWQEALVGVAAHELAHAMQFETGSPRSEIEAEHAALRAVERFRAERASLGLDALAERERAEEEARRAERADKRSPEARRRKIEEDILRWERKARGAQVRLKKLQRRLRDHDRRAAARSAAQ
jgi:hypothetical protein